MNIQFEKLLVLLVLLSMALTSINTIVLHGAPLAREEAIEISRNTELVRSRLEDADRYTIEAYHLNQTQIHEIIEQWPYRRAWYPEDHNVWVVTWHIHKRGEPSATADLITHIIDAETGQITSEGTLVLR